MQSDVNWFGVLAHHALRAPDRPMTVFEGRVTTYADMEARAIALAGGLSERGVRKGDAVGLLSYNCPEFLQVVFAANYLGAVAMPINWRLAPPEVRYILEHSQARALVCDEALQELAGAATDGMEATLVRACISDVTPPGGWSSITELEAAPAPPPRVPADPDDLHRLMYTSGTTGRPKGVMISHANLSWKNLAHITEFGFTSADLGLACGPLYHVGALDLTTTSLIGVGAPTIIHRTFDAAAVVDELERLEGDRGLAGARHGQRYHGGTRPRGARPLLGAPDHQRRREDADPTRSSGSNAPFPPPGSPTRTG